MMCMKNILRTASFVVILGSITGLARAQIFSGLTTGNFSGSNGMLINPAEPASGRIPWDINLIAAGFSAGNNYLYLPDAGLFTLGNTTVTGPGYRDVRHMDAHENTLLQLPSAFKRFDNFAAGFFITARSAGFFRSGTYTPGINAYGTIPLNTIVAVPQFKTGMLNWNEIGINLEKVLRENGLNALYVGANLKYLMGFDALTFSNNTPFTFITHDDGTTDVSGLDAQYNYTSNFGSDAWTDISNYKIRGGGVGADLGLVYEVRNRNTYNYRNPVHYIWKIGVSVRDIGFVRLNRDAGSYQLTSATGFSTQTATLDSISDLDEFTKTASRVLYDNVSASQTDDRFSALLPAAFVFSADRNLGNGFFIAGILQQRIPEGKAGIQSANTLYVIPRFEKRWFTISAPMELYEYAQFHPGIAARIAFFTIGTDNMLSLIRRPAFTGTDLYAGVKIDPLWLNKADGHAKQLECPAVWK